MLRSLNYTGRIELTDDEVSFALVELDGSNYLDVSWNLSAHTFSQSSRMKLTVKALYDSLDFDLGTVSTTPGTKRLDITNLRNGLESDLRFVVLSEDSSKIPIISAIKKGAANTLNGIEIPKSSLLETRSNSTLNVPWQLSTDDGRPILELPSNSNLHSQLLESDFFDPIVVIPVLERIVDWLLWDRSPDKDNAIAEKWIAFFAQFDVNQEFFVASADKDDFDVVELTEVKRTVNILMARISMEFNLQEIISRMLERE